MPMSFPDMNSLTRAAQVHNFRKPLEDETEEDYRKALHEHVKPRDQIESFEILFGVGWDQWTPDQQRQSLGM